MECYVFDLGPLRARLDEAMARLSPERREKAARLRREEPRLRSVGAGLLLAHFFPGRAVSVSPGGKPAIPGERRFSLSHSGELAVIALADVPAGVDVQRIGPASEALRRRVLTPEERLFAAGSDEAFFFLWTRKEAALKCLGVGLDRPLASFDVRGDSLVLDGEAIGLYSLRRGDYMLSTAALGGSAAFTPKELTTEELLK